MNKLETVDVLLANSAGLNMVRSRPAAQYSTALHHFALAFVQ
jgi:hypothetical protein